MARKPLQDAERLAYVMSILGVDVSDGMIDEADAARLNALKPGLVLTSPPVGYRGADGVLKRATQAQADQVRNTLVDDFESDETELLKVGVTDMDRRMRVLEGQ